MKMRIEYLTLFLFLFIISYPLLQASTVAAVACSGTVTGEDEISGPICGNITNNGTANIDSSVLFDGAKPCIGGCNGGSLFNHGTVNINRTGTLEVGGSNVTNNGVINMVSGSILTSCANCGAGPGQISGSGTVNINGGTLSGPLTVNGNVANLGGTVQPGGTLTLGSYAQGGNGRLSFNIGGLLPGTQYDVLKVNGPISINGGSVQVSLANNFQPKVGDKFNILTGQIQRISLSSPISLPPLPSGEFWGRANFGSFFELSVQQVQPPVVGSPEPGSFLLIGSGFAWLVGRQWRKHARSMQAARY